jgi:hypothetical protein
MMARALPTIVESPATSRSAFRPAERTSGKAMRTFSSAVNSSNKLMI